MNTKLIILSIIAALALVSASNLNNIREQVKGAHYAVIVAGSDGWWNYRHQSDAFHAYHILLDNGMPKENIILFAKDDIANNSRNPFPGKVFNKPDPNGEGQDYYEGVVIDYKGADVTPENFMKVLKGDKDGMQGVGSGRVLESTAEDNVFINFTDHGGVGLIAFPSEYLYAKDLNETFKAMHTKNMYKKLVFYLEACESGSMFEDLLPEDINIYATSAANPHESSWAAYCSPQDRVNGKSIGSCLGDAYSINWMEDSDSHKSTETLAEQFELVKKKTTRSEVMEWGTKSFKQDTILAYQGTASNIFERKSIKSVLMKFMNKVIKQVTGEEITKEINQYERTTKQADYLRYLDIAKKSTVDSRDVYMHYLQNMIATTNEQSFKTDLEKELELRSVVDERFMNFSIDLKIDINGSHAPINFDCLKPSVEHYRNTCGDKSEYSIKYVKNIALACKVASVEEIVAKIDELC